MAKPEYKMIVKKQNENKSTINKERYYSETCKCNKRKV